MFANTILDGSFLPVIYFHYEKLTVLEWSWLSRKFENVKNSTISKQLLSHRLSKASFSTLPTDTEWVLYFQYSLCCLSLDVVVVACRDKILRLQDTRPAVGREEGEEGGPTLHGSAPASMTPDYLGKFFFVNPALNDSLVLTLDFQLKQSTTLQIKIIHTSYITHFAYFIPLTQSKLIL